MTIWLLVLAIPFLFWIYRRGSMVERMSKAKGLDENADLLPETTPYEDVVGQEDGLTLSRKSDFDSALSAQDKMAGDRTKIVPGALSRFG